MKDLVIHKNTLYGCTMQIIECSIRRWA